MNKTKKAKNARSRSERMQCVWSEFKTTGSEELRNQLVENYLPYVRSTAERLKTKLPECVDINDLYSAGILGLIDAVNKFEPERGIRFETYCSLRIRGAILDDLRASDWVPRLVRTRAQKLQQATDDLRAELNREPSDDEIARRMGMSGGEFDLLRREVGEIASQFSLENRWHESGRGDNRGDLQPLEMLEDRRQQNPLDFLQRAEIRELAIRGLSEKERAVIAMYYFDCATMKEIGEVLGLSESRVCQIHTQAIDMLKRKFEMMQEDMSRFD